MYRFPGSTGLVLERSFNAQPVTISVTLEAVFTVNHLTDIDKQNSTGNTQTKYNADKQTVQITAKQNYPGSVTSYDTQPGNEMGLLYNASEPTQDPDNTSFVHKI